MRSFLPLLGGLLAGIGTASAQTTFGFGPRLGGNLATGTFTTIDQAAGSSGADYSYSRGSILGYQAGLAASVSWGHWAFQPALVFTEKGLTQRATYSSAFGGGSYAETDKFTSRVHYLELPLNVVYSFGANGEGFQLFAGPYLAIGVGGHTDYAADLGFTNSSGGTTTTQSMSYSGSAPFTFGSTFPEPDPNSSSGADVQSQARRFDAGITAGVGYRRGPYQAQLGYGLGLLNAQPDYPASYQMPNDSGYLRTTQLTLSYYFPVGAK